MFLTFPLVETMRSDLSYCEATLKKLGQQCGLEWVAKPLKMGRAGLDKLFLATDMSHFRPLYRKG